MCTSHCFDRPCLRRGLITSVGLALALGCSAARAERGDGSGAGGTTAPTAEKSAAPDKTPIPCECTVLEHIPKFMYCDHDDVPAGSPSSLGYYPAFRIKLTKPTAHHGREIVLIFRDATFKAPPALRGKYVGKRCTLDLPADFLAGPFKRHFGYPDPHFEVLR